MRKPIRYAVAGLAVLYASLAVAAEAKLEEVSIHYQSEGTGKTAVVFVHGWTCDHTFWRLNVPAVAETRRVLAIDLPGHGQSAKPDIEYSIALFARAVEAVMREAGVEKAVLVGHSMGVPVIRQFHREFPGKVAGLVMVDGGVPRGVSDEAARRRFAERFRSGDFKQKAGQAIDSMFVSTTAPALREEIKTTMLATPEHVAVSAYAGMAEPYTMRLDKIEQPVLFIAARRPSTAEDLESFLRTLMPDLEFQLWDGVGHFLMMEEPERFNRALIGFLDAKGL